MELEYKFRLSGGAGGFLAPALRALFAAGASACEAETVFMRSAYYDTDRKALLAAGITLRFRLENGAGTVTVKQGTVSARGFSKRREWEARADDILSGIDKTEADEAVRSLISEAAPRLKVFAEVAFTRLRLPVRLPGCKAELALDSGVFPNGKRFDELELELISGDEGAFHRLAAHIKKTLGLEDEPRSKLARAAENRAE